MLVVRIETEDGTGPYRLRDNEGECVLYGITSDRHPSPWGDEDLEPHISVDMYFGCESYKALYDWFDSDMLEKLREYNCFIAEYEATQVYKGHKQLMFHKESSALIKKYIL